MLVRAHVVGGAVQLRIGRDLFGEPMAFTASIRVRRPVRREHLLRAAAEFLVSAVVDEPRVRLGLRAVHVDRVTDLAAGAFDGELCERGRDRAKRRLVVFERVEVLVDGLIARPHHEAGARPQLVGYVAVPAQ